MRSLVTLHNSIRIYSATDYFTRWTEAIPLWKVNEDEVISFIEKFIINRYDIPDALIFDKAFIGRIGEIIGKNYTHSVLY